MVTITSANKVLREVYLDVLTQHLDEHTNYFYNRIQKDSQNIANGSAHAIGRYGINGGVGSGTETADLPQASANTYVRFKAAMRNIYGTVEISDKILRANANTVNGLVNVLNDEMEGLLGAAKFNFARMLFQNGDGILTTVTEEIEDEGLHANSVPVASTKNLIEGMLIDIMKPNGTKKITHAKVEGVDRKKSEIKLGMIVPEYELEEGDILVLQDSYKAEIFGLPYIFDKKQIEIYGVIRVIHPYLHPTVKTSEAISSDIIQETIDDIEEAGGCDINLLLCSYDMRRAYFNHLSQTRMNIDYMNLDGGFKALSYNGIPLVTDRFVPNGQMYFLNTDDFKLAQLNDWDWIQNSAGKVLRPMENKAAYTATLVKYANLICVRPVGQGLLKLGTSED